MKQRPRFNSSPGRPLKNGLPVPQVTTAHAPWRGSSTSPNSAVPIWPDRPDEVIVARIVAPHGLAGEFRAVSLTDFPEDLHRLKEVVLEGRTRETFILKSVRAHGTMLLFTFDGIDSIEGAEMFRNALVKIPRSQAHELPPNHYYVGDILGMEVVTEDGRSMGQIRQVRRTGSNDVYCSDGAMIPATHEAVLEMDVAGRRMVVLSALIVEE